MWCKTSFLKTIILFLALISCSMAACSAILSMSMQFKKAEINLTEFGNYIPKHFVVDEKYDSIIASKSRKDISSVFAFLSYLEGHYHNFLLSHGEISQNATIEFSKQAFASKLVKICTENEKYKNICGKITTDDGVDLEGVSLSLLVEVVSKIPEMMNSLFPASICPLNEEVGNYDCENNYQSPISFNIKDVTFATGIDSIKEMINDVNRPVLFTMPELFADYYIPCDDKRVSNNSECSLDHQTLDCPFNRSQKCGKLSFPAKTMSGDFYLPLEPIGVSVGDPINLEIVGYSDSFITSVGRANLEHAKASKGGFIVKGLSQDEGYPLPYLAGELALSKALAKCPNNHAAQFWTGPLLQCMLKYNDLVKCSSRAEEVDEDDSETEYYPSNRLVCINEKYCDPDKVYYITHQPVRTREIALYEEESGMTLTKLVESDNETATEIDFNQVPFYRLGTVFSNVDEIHKSNQCGYWFLPYDVVDKAIVMSRTVSQHVLAMNLDVEFTESSLLSKMENGDFLNMLKKFSKLPLREKQDYKLNK